MHYSKCKRGIQETNPKVVIKNPRWCQDKYPICLTFIYTVLCIDIIYQNIPN